MTTKRIHKKGLQNRYRVVLHGYEEDAQVWCLRALRRLKVYPSLSTCMHALTVCKDVGPVILKENLSKDDADHCALGLSMQSRNKLDVRVQKG